ncbi:hypothetical protein F751_2965 [Auxenochlorella protothecoides]|uniref:Uncharacterized protein n=1 Tax=Auxenochlorella protothecoides TaxID=3075 RepID=A0A087SAM0_AUXPR|nr:hypothetical protein F751_2965 [Auxenochlorella protothecoides]KFM22774.1 hypothetical protein F751_2965 [Auxenochlorella protothecoides]
MFFSREARQRSPGAANRPLHLPTSPGESTSWVRPPSLLPLQQRGELRRLGGVQGLARELDGVLEHQAAALAPLPRLGHALVGDDLLRPRQNHGVAGPHPQHAIVQGGHVQAVGVERLHQRQRHGAVQIVAVAAEPRMWQLLDDEHQVLARGAGAGVALALKGDFRPLLPPGLQLDLQSLLHLARFACRVGHVARDLELLGGAVEQLREGWVGNECCVEPVVRRGGGGEVDRKDAGGKGRGQPPSTGECNVKDVARPDCQPTQTQTKHHSLHRTHLFQGARQLHLNLLCLGGRALAHVVTHALEPAAAPPTKKVRAQATTLRACTVGAQMKGGVKRMHYVLATHPSPAACC